MEVVMKRERLDPVHSDKAREDIEYVARAIEGDQRAYAFLMDKYKESIYFLLLKMVNNKTDAEDLTLEAFGKAFKNLKYYSSSFAFSTWLFKIASNNGIDFLRRKRGLTVSINSEDGQNEESKGWSVISEDLNPQEEMMRTQTIMAVRDVVSNLKPRYRALVEMRYFQEMTYEEISEKTALPLGTVKIQLFRARDLLYNILKNTDAADGHKQRSIKEELE